MNPENERFTVEDAGHTYLLANVDGGTQTLQFIRKAPAAEGSTDLVTMINGTTNEAVVDVLIDRMKFLNDMLPCNENVAIITCLEEVRTLIAQRTADRAERGVLSTSNA